LGGRRQSRSAAVLELCLSLCLPLCSALPLGCHQRAYMVPLADAGINDAGPGDLLAPLTLDISVTGCPTFDVVDVVCSGTAPLTVSFSPVGSPALTSFRWSFGDGTPSSLERAPSHTYALPGEYDVGVIGKGDTVGSVSQVRHDLISVQALATGAACDVDIQCSDGLRCLCKSGSGCGPAFSRGICSTACATGFCGAGAVCAAFALGASMPISSSDAGSASDAGTTTSPVCLADCSGGAACASGFVCQQIPGGGGAAPWVHGCLPLGASDDFGASCRNANGVLDDAACTTGLCADVGDLGLCSAACDGTHPCPAGAACARLSATTQLCLPACSATTPCTGDPSLGCTLATAADAGIDGGLAITAGDPGLAYCAPR
jgi:PKD repeat protein